MPEVGLDPELPGSRAGALSIYAVLRFSVQACSWNGAMRPTPDPSTTALRCWIDFEKQIAPSVMPKLQFETMTLENMS